MRAATRLVPLVIIATMGLTACTGSGGGGDLSWEDSPLSRYLSAAYGGDLSQEEQERKMAERQKQVEELVAECMTEEGFEYTPVDQRGGMSFSSGDEWKPDDREWVAQYGYGAVDWPGREEMESAVPDDEFVDPNQDYVESLSESERQAYQETLWGAAVMEEQTEEQTEEGGTYEYRWEDHGCQGKAQHETDSETNVWEREEFADLQKAINQLYNELGSHPDLAELDAKWASCMADAGYDGFSKQQDAQQSVYDDMNAFYEKMPQPDPNLSEAEMTAFYEDAEKERRAQQEPIQEKEVELALADLDCREKTDYRDAQLKIQFAIEEQFIADHKTELEAFKAAAEQQG